MGPVESSAPVESITRGSLCGMNGSVTGSEPAAMIACSKLTSVVPPSASSTSTWYGRDEPAEARDDGDLALPGQAGEAAGEPLDHAVLPAAQLVEVDSRGAEHDAVLAHLLGFGDDLGGVQQRLGRDAADIEADAAERRPAIDQHDLLAEIGGAEGGGVAARPGAEHQHLGSDVACAAAGPGAARAQRGGMATVPAGRPAAGLASGLYAGEDQAALRRRGHPTLTQTLRDGARPTGDGISMRRLVGFERDQRVLGV